ncbi:MAG TPA: DUF72 domain-containing protein [Longimicrobiaceae bacterium]|nr:DUF72 domain-containing protein [Longimicrobiaceae bacterium]
MIRYGPAGWSYDDWAGIVYPRPKPKGFDPLQYLAGYFDTIEVNSTFYRPARREVAEKWLRRTRFNPAFRFTAKLWKRFTHERKEAWTAAEVAQARAAFDPMLDEGKLGALLLQFPWSFRRTDENREWLDDLAGAFADFPLVLEVRHESWNTPELFRELGERGIGFVNIDQPLFHDSIAPSAHATSPVGYVRVHGRNYRDWFRDKAAPHERYDYLYTAEELEPWAERAREIDAEPRTRDTFVVTNNHYRGKGITNAVMLRSLVEGKRVPAPPGLFAEYGEALEGHAWPAEPEPQPG